MLTFRNDKFQQKQDSSSEQLCADHDATAYVGSGWGGQQDGTAVHQPSESHVQEGVVTARADNTLVA